MTDNPPRNSASMLRTAASGFVTKVVLIVIGGVIGYWINSKCTLVIRVDYKLEAHEIKSLTNFRPQIFGSDLLIRETRKVRSSKNLGDNPVNQDPKNFWVKYCMLSFRRCRFSCLCLRSVI